MTSLRKILHHASAGGRYTVFELVVWALVGGAVALIAIAMVLSLEPGR